jgi:hypothetical protein
MSRARSLADRTGHAAALAALPALGAVLALAAPARATSPPPPVVVDSFESSAAWTAMPASGVEMKLSLEPGVHGSALRVDFRFTKGGGYAVLHRKVELELPEHYAFTYRVRGVTAPQNLEFKLLDETGENVWWRNRTDFVFPERWTEERVRKRQISFAWGPRGGGEIRRVAALEFAITAGSGGEGTVWFDDLTLVPMLPPAAPRPPSASASSEHPAHAAGLAADTSLASWWESAHGDTAPALTLDLGSLREFGGLVLDWVADRHARDYVVEAEEGTGAWRELRVVRASDGGRDWLQLPESEAWRVRVRALARGGRTVALANLDVKPLAWGARADDFLSAVARDSRRGNFPRGFLGEQSYWTVTGVDGDADEGLLDEDLRLETGRAQFSLEPFLFTESGLRTWAEGRGTQSLASGALPIPTATRTVDSLALSVTAFARGARGASELVARYRVRNLAPRPRSVTLLVAIRPFQVNPPSQFLNVPGGAARIDRLRHEGGVVRVNADRWLAAAPAPDAFLAQAFDEGDFVERLRVGRVPRRDTLEDPVGRGSGALRWTFDLPGDGTHEVALRIPFHGRGATGEPFGTGDAAAWESAAERGWHGRLGTFSLEAGGEGADVALTLAAQLGYVLVNRDGAGIQPGSRSYERSWIRDGSLTSSALLRSGLVEPVREYLEWYAGFQYADGKVPCCVDRRGSDPVPEHDSHGEFIFLAAEYLRLTGDRATVARLWPHVRAAAAYLDTLRAQRRTAAWRGPGKEPYFGLLPPSISHEGYSARPMHSYWDDLFALRGYRDAAWLAGELGRAGDGAWLRASRDGFAREFAAAVRAAMRAHRIDYVPGCSDLGDFDATSTTIALSPVQAGDVLPPEGVARTFERYWEFFRRRRDGSEKWDAYTPYELRNVGAFVRLGWRERANELLRWFLDDRRPAGWRHWAEVVDREPRRARFLGDMPHTWVGTDFVRAVQEMLAHERESDGALVLAAGVPADWLAGDGVKVSGLRTRWGTLGYTLRRKQGRVELALDASALRNPPGGIEFAPPVDSVAAARWTRSAAVRADGRLAPLERRDGRFRWTPSQPWSRPPRVLEWGHALERAAGSPARRQVLGP